MDDRLKTLERRLAADPSDFSTRVEWAVEKSRIASVAEPFDPEKLCATGTLVRTTDVIGGTGGMLVAEKNIAAAREAFLGFLWGYVPGHGGDVWWVRHLDGSAAPYMIHELEVLG